MHKSEWKLVREEFRRVVPRANGDITVSARSPAFKKWVVTFAQEGKSTLMYEYVGKWPSVMPKIEEDIAAIV